MDTRKSPGVEDGHAYTSHTCSYSGHKGDDGKHSFPFCILDPVHTSIIPDIMGCKDSTGVRNSGEGTTSDEERFNTVSTDIGDEAS